MKALSTLAPLFWKYKGRLIAGIIFILFTNVLAVFAPALVGEGVNVMRDAYTTFLENGDYVEGSRLELPKILATVGEYTGLGVDWDGTVNDKSDVYRLVSIISKFQAILYLLVLYVKGV